MTDSIIELNRDVEQYVIQSSIPRSRNKFEKLYGDKFTPLTFVHTSDIHNALDIWNRMVEYINYYSDYISFALHTGDYCGGSQKSYTDMYGEGDRCERPIYNCVGNHDCFSGEGEWSRGEKKTAYGLLFNHADAWDVEFMDCPYSMSYYKDFPDSNLRMIVLDDYYHIDETRKWLSDLLDDAMMRGLHVLTAQHEPTNYMVDTFEVKYNTLDDYVATQKAYELARENDDFDRRGRLLFEDIIADFIRRGGKHVCNIAGHHHVDQFGVTELGVLNVVVPNGTTWDKNGDMKRVRGTRSMDCFNVVSVDTELGLLKLVRIGANVDHYLRSKKALCFDYINKKVISEL